MVEQKPRLDCGSVSLLFGVLDKVYIFPEEDSAKRLEPVNWTAIMSLWIQGQMILHHHYEG